MLNNIVWNHLPKVPKIRRVASRDTARKQSVNGKHLNIIFEHIVSHSTKIEYFPTYLLFIWKPGHTRYIFYCR